MAWCQRLHPLQGLVERIEQVFIVFEVPFFVRRHVEILFADEVGPVITNGISQLILEPVTRQYHDGAVHARDDMPRDHHSAGRAVILEDPRFYRLEP